MIVLLNKDWIFSKSGESFKKCVNLPHDAMIKENRSVNSNGGTNNAYFNCGTYSYLKTIEVTDLNKEYYLEFEGVYKDAEIHVNNIFVKKNLYGYNRFFVYLNNLQIGKNEIKVIVNNEDLPNSRWYSGTGIYRDVYLHILEKKHILIDGIKIKTIDYNRKLINIDILTSCKGELNITFKQNNLIYKRKIETNGKINIDLQLLEFKLWNPNDPNLVTCSVKFFDDIQEVRFGIRKVELSLDYGLLINGKNVLLRGACVHHDNGILGAKCYKESEYRKVNLIKEAGYNAIRSAHNPCSKHMLNACDELGILILDEYVDMWYIHKTQFDYADSVENNYKEDLSSMINKDYNHPSVIMYSIGNEVSETSEKRGIELTKRMTEFIKEIDDTRPITCGVNIFFNFLYSIGFGQYSDKKAKKNAGLEFKKKKKTGSEFFNTLAGKLGANFMKRGATLYWCDKKTKDAFSYLDIAGYNYGIKRYKHDLKKYPDRFILGTETFCVDAYDFMNISKSNPRLIGDFVWSGIDYLGEVGVGSWVVDEECNYDFSYSLGWNTAGSGRIDITGKSNSEVDYTRVCFDIDKINIGVIPVFHYKNKTSPSAWKLSRCISNWTYHGYEGYKTEVEVYSKEKYVELYLNDKLIGKKRFKNKPLFKFKVKYYPGELKAVSYDEKHNFVAECVLKTGEKESLLKLIREKEYTFNNDLVYIRLLICDKNNIVQAYKKETIKITNVKNGKLIGIGNGCPYSKTNYNSNCTETYYGEALLIIKTTDIKKNIVVEVKSDNYNEKFVV